MKNELNKFIAEAEEIYGFREIGEKYEYKKDEIEMYGKFIEMCLEHFKKNTAVGLPLGG